jgi:hypothetical protein
MQGLQVNIRCAASSAHVRLSTGAANRGARAFYERIGYALSDVTLTRELRPTPR